MHNGLPHHCVFPQEPLSWSNDPTTATGQQPQAVFHTRSLYCCWSEATSVGARQRTDGLGGGADRAEEGRKADAMRRAGTRDRRDWRSRAEMTCSSMRSYDRADASGTRRRRRASLLRAARPTTRSAPSPRRARPHPRSSHDRRTSRTLARGLRPGVDEPERRATTLHGQDPPLGALFLRPRRVPPLGRAYVRTRLDQSATFA
jgi:hypothetical protein